MIKRTVVSALAVWFAMSAPAFAQDASVAGSVVDESKAVLPGVAVTAIDTETSRQFTAVTSDRGEYRLLGLSPGRYRITAELAGFAPVAIESVELLVGQNAAMSFTLKLGDRQRERHRQRPRRRWSTRPRRASPATSIGGRWSSCRSRAATGSSWRSMVKGITANTINNQPGVSRDAAFSLNLDGQEITQNMSMFRVFGQPGISRDAIAEFQVITNLFDVTMGRSVGIQVQAISRAGTNNFDGSFYGFFRDDKLNAKDAFANRVLPYSNSADRRHLRRTDRASDKACSSSAPTRGSASRTRRICTGGAAGGQRFEMPTLKPHRKAWLGRVDYQIGIARSPDRRDHGYWQTSRHTGLRAPDARSRQPLSTRTTCRPLVARRQRSPAARGEGQLLPLSLARRAGSRLAADPRATASPAWRSAAQLESAAELVRELLHDAVRHDVAQGPSHAIKIGAEMRARR